MATIKSYTTIEQSHKLAEILPFESSDAFYDMAEPEKRQKPIVGSPDEYLNMADWAIPCWSLAALLGVLLILDNRSLVLSKTFDRKYRVVYHSTAYERAILTSDYDNPVDACYEMIIKLHELNLL